MRFEIKPTEEDYLAFQLFAASQSERIQKRIRNSKWLISGFFLMFALFYYFDGENIFLTIYFIAFSLACIVFYKRYALWIYRRHYKKHGQEVYSKKFDQPAIVEFTEKALHTSDFTGEGKYYYNQLISASETDNHFFITQTSGIGIIIPKRDLKNIDEFRDEILSHGIPIEDFKGWKW